MNKTRQAVETVNFRLYFEVIIRQNETQYFCSVYMLYVICINSDWMVANKRSLNASKTECMLIGSHKKLQQNRNENLEIPGSNDR